MPNKWLVGAIAVFGAIATVVGLLADLGAPAAWIVTGLVVAAAGAAMWAFGGERLTYAQALVVVLLGVAVWLAIENRSLAHRLSRERAKLAQAHRPPSSYDFTVVDGEVDPDTDSFSTDTDYAYERVRPESSAHATPGGSHPIGDHVRVTCAVGVDSLDGSGWYRLVNGNFMSGSTIEQAPYGGGHDPPACPDS
jgi:hypothetical protein